MTNDIGKIELTNMPIDMLTPADYNPRNMSEKAREGLNNSITSFGLLQPIIWNRQTGNVVGGHQRLYDIISKGATHTDVKVVDWPLAKEKSANIALNHVGVSGTYDEAKLATLLNDISDQDKIDFNFDSLETPEWENLPEIKDPQNLDDPNVAIKITIPAQAAYMKEEIAEGINNFVQQHWPGNEIKIK